MSNLKARRAAAKGKKKLARKKKADSIRRHGYSSNHFRNHTPTPQGLDREAALAAFWG